MATNFASITWVFVHLTVSAIAITDNEFKTILESRCEEYQRIFKPNLKTNCADATTAFLDIFDIDGAACKREGFESFVKMTQQLVDANKGMLWSGTEIKNILEQISLRGRRYMPITFTLTGYMMDDFQICKDVKDGSAGCKGCTSDNAEKQFWKMASEYYAKSLSGNITVVLSARIKNGKESIYYNDSILATTEIPNLPKYPIIESVEVWPVESVSVAYKDQIKNKCDQDSVKKLEELIKGKDILYNCVAPSKIPLFAMCLNKPYYCSLPSRINGQTNVKPQIHLMAAVMASAIVFIRF